ncbi:BTB/POZ and math domain-containing protein 4 [Phtheirospermum japonicum]|uniref:BTB/POZ and math domain-containing protein 4 n=1 Tax=Phtheirospermum japonicum TaxID=374723 RepID=A0A830BLN6_9LAMI|nr:BTB/POZ and math domain-containing protein 4 [Phtheirospermum japonicum]
MKTGSHDWTLKNYSLRKGTGVIESDEFTVCGHRWVIRLYPNGKKAQTYNWGAYASLFLSLMDDESSSSNASDPVQVSIGLFLLDQSGQGDHWDKDYWTVSFLKPGGLVCCGCDDYIRRCALESRRYLKDDCLNIRCDIRVFTGQTQKLPLIKVPAESNNIRADFGKLLESKESADVFFKVGDESFWGHKWILVASSPVFRSLLLDNCHHQSEIVVPDLEPRIFKAMLWFIYTGTLVDEEQKAVNYPGLFILNSFVGKTLAAAHQFELKNLKKICESRILGKISAESVAYVLHLAELYHATELKAACLRFAAENREAILESEGCEYLKQSCPSLFVELAYNKPSSSEGGVLDFRCKILSAAMEPFVALFSLLGASDTKHTKET